MHDAIAAFHLRLAGVTLPALTGSLESAGGRRNHGSFVPCHTSLLAAGPGRPLDGSVEYRTVAANATRLESRREGAVARAVRKRILPDLDFPTPRTLQRFLSAAGLIEEATRGFVVYTSTWRAVS